MRNAILKNHFKPATENNIQILIETKINVNLLFLRFLHIKQGTASPIITTVTPPITATIAISNVENLFASVLLDLSVPVALDGLVTFCDVAVEGFRTVVGVLTV